MLVKRNEKEYIEEQAKFRVDITSLMQKRQSLYCQKTHYGVEEIKESKQWE